MNLFKVILLSIITSLPIYGQRQYQKQVYTHAIDNIDEFIEFLSYPNDANFKSDINELINWSIDKFQSLDFKIQKLDTETFPLLLASKHLNDDFKTILIYLHLDGQPIDLSKWNQKDPFTPVYKIKENGKFLDYEWSKIKDLNYNDIEDNDIRIFARSASDAKGPVMMLIQALKFMELNGIDQGFNLKLVMDFEEEKSSPSLPYAVEKYSELLKSDALLIFDGPQHESDLPTLNFGNRGISSITLKTYGPIVPQHSGHFGNYAPNPVFRMSNILSSMKEENGIVKIKGYYDGIQITDEVMQYLDDVPDNEKIMRDKMQFKVPESVGSTYQESLQFPSLNVRGIRAGWVGSEARTIIPSECIAEIDVRLVIESDGYRLNNLIKNHIKSLGYEVLDHEPSKEERMRYDKIIKFNAKVSYPAFRTDINSELGRWLTQTLTETFGVKPVLKRTSGGSVPISPFVNILNIPAVGVPTVNKDNNQHSPNENIKINNYVKGIEAFIGILSSEYN
ncbi:MAG: M20/M25/M40 family metallo-hydrolase [Cryomorphaceae bacterium]|nr:M20/M25/M40 family metallo-hydrolase [Cryomorphaceae bacterium]